MLIEAVKYVPFHLGDITKPSRKSKSCKFPIMASGFTILRNINGRNFNNVLLEAYIILLEMNCNSTVFPG